MRLCCQHLMPYRMKGLNFHGPIRSHGQARILPSCELQHSALCELHLVGDEINFQLATKKTEEKAEPSIKPAHSVRGKDNGK